MTWANVMQTCVASDLGTPLAYVKQDDQIVINPQGSHIAEFTGLILAVLNTAKWGGQDLINAVAAQANRS